ncbi:ABC transporter ATP-binding protein [Nonomuraea sp. KC401]|uniref:ABC transporter ATP-binding protein n=1 Tax=unclassified Nonomuraea TaxID=2593643 RepID=UPI0010FF5B6D|nr:MULTISPECIES: ABC transporter ATP-binding protein [unclassified Nonomuraea]NBE96316.1 ATP-binding cassette domain-containing protein [Nonomuraea sp. K271]TLF68214.1 ABC transporter ATP-binding protein [Nonomuraea sp. KC401]
MSDPALSPVTAAGFTEPPQVEMRRLPGLLGGALKLTLAAARREFLLITALQAVGGLGLVLPILGGRDLLDKLLVAEAGLSLAGMLLQGALILGLLGVIGLATAVATSRDDVLSEQLNRYALGRVLDVACTIELEQFERPEFHNRLERASMSARIRPHQLTQGLAALTSAAMSTVGIALALAAIEPLLVPATLLAGVPLWFAGLKSGRVLFDALFRLTPAERERSYLLDVLTTRRAAKEVRAFGLAGYLRSRWERRTDERLAEIRVTAWRRLRITILARLTSGVALGSVLGLVLAMAVTGGMAVADAGAAATAILLLGVRLRGAAAGTDQLFEAAPFLQDLQGFVAFAPGSSLPPQSPNLPQLGKAPQAPQAVPEPVGFRRLRVENLTFRYPSGRHPVLRNVSMEIGVGQVVALVGENGSGKTTLAKLLSHLYRPQSGRILYDDVDVTAADPDRLRHSIAVLFQDFQRYLLSATDNVGMGRWEKADDRAAVTQATRAAGAHDFLAALPQGYESLLGPEFAGGIDLSGGQWQRVALARAFFREAPFIILDEPTATLDARAEHLLFEQLRTLLAGRTVLLISHRFATVRMADHIYVLDGGQVAEHGTHDQLMSASGRYAELFTLQAAGYLDSQPRDSG